MKPKLIVIGGSLATGKTTVASALAAHLGVRRVGMDHIKEALFDLGGFRDRAWSKEIGRIAFEVFKHLIDLHLRAGESVIAESTFIWPSDADWLKDFAKKYHVELVQIWMTADPKVARERFLARARSGERHPGHCDTVETVLEEFDERYFSKTFKPLPLPGRTLVVDTTNFATIDHDAIVRFVGK
jgi:predicted kinase